MLYLLLRHYRNQQVRFRWIEEGTSSKVTWSIDDVYIGRACVSMCNGHGHCEVEPNDGVAFCVCEPGFYGDDCSHVDDNYLLMPFFYDTFDSSGNKSFIYSENSFH